MDLRSSGWEDNKVVVVSESQRTSDWLRCGRFEVERSSKHVVPFEATKKLEAPRKLGEFEGRSMGPQLSSAVGSLPALGALGTL